MANTTIRIKKSGVSGNVPGSLALGELALNYTDGLLYFANSTGITSFSANALSNTGTTITVNGVSQLVISNTANSYSTTNNALIISGGVGVSNSIYVGNRVGFANSNNISVVYQTWNSATNSLDVVFG